MNYSDYIVYVDESGDHGLKNINPEYPVFVLSFCIFRKSDYIKGIAPALNLLKLKYWGHSEVVLHERDIRKSMSGDWTILNDAKTRTCFLNDISKFIQEASFHLIACVIRKQKLAEHNIPRNPYEVAMLFCMERLNNWLIRANQHKKVIQLNFESRGKKEDNELELEFRRICDGNPGTFGSSTDFSQIDYAIRFLDKKSNSTGLQIADLIARPIGLHVLRPSQTNKAFPVIEDKFIRHGTGYKGRGLKAYP